VDLGALLLDTGGQEMSNETEQARMADELISLRQDNIGLRLALRAKQDQVDNWVGLCSRWQNAYEVLHNKVRALAATRATIAEVRQEQKIREEDEQFAREENHQWTS
jgi:hypothetical protein